MVLLFSSCHHPQVQLPRFIIPLPILQLSSPSSTTPSLHHMTAQKLEDIHVACEFPHVFPDDLPGMPPDREVEFTIELQPDT
jgi:hypothetical protein